MTLATPFYPPRTRPVVTVATVLDDPSTPLRCRRCGRRCRETVHGLGPRCLRLYDLARPRRWRIRGPREVEHAGPDLLDLLDDCVDSWL
jgi:hypothetical protein